MIDPVSRQYEAYPYPARNPADEASRLITGSPSHPFEIDHFLFGGARDWSQPFRALVAGGGTGDGLIMLAQILADHGVDADITYIDMSTASRATAEARVEARGLTSIKFITGDLLAAPELGPFDYIDCCGVLHHLPDPDAGFAALRAALAPGGGIGAMVYAPYGRDGVYPLQDILRSLVGHLEPAEQVAAARRLLETLPSTHPFLRNPFVKDHVEGGDAGLYDLLLHSRDRAYDVPELTSALDRADLEIASFVMPGTYDPRMLLAEPFFRQRAMELSLPERWAMAERLSGNMKTHIFYAKPKDGEQTVAAPAPGMVPNLIDMSASALAESIWKTGALRWQVDGLNLQRQLPQEAAGLVVLIDGKRSLGGMQNQLKWPNEKFEQLFGEIYQPLNNFNLLRFSGLGRFAASGEAT